MRLQLKMDYDSPHIQVYFQRRVRKLYRVFYATREYFPDLVIEKVERSRHGWHVIGKITLSDNEFTEFQSNKQFERASIILIQSFLGSDMTRSLYDLLRTFRLEDDWNFLFMRKGDFTVIENSVLKDKLNRIIAIERAKIQKLADALPTRG